MGTWGPGNFESDHGLDFLDAHLEKLVAHIESQFIPEKLDNSEFPVYVGDHEIMPALEILITICEGLDKSPGIEIEQVENWRQKYLQAFDQWASHGSYPPEFEQERRQVLVNTFERLVQFMS